jgi:hypothetical protein
VNAHLERQLGFVTAQLGLREYVLVREVSR